MLVNCEGMIFNLYEFRNVFRFSTFSFPLEEEKIGN